MKKNAEKDRKNWDNQRITQIRQDKIRENINNAGIVAKIC